MNTLARYLSGEIIKSTLFVFALLLALFAFFDVLNQLQDIGKGRYQLWMVFLFVGLSLPARIYELFPIATLIGSLHALSQLSSNSEYTVIRASGVSNLGVVKMLLPAGLLFAVLTYVFGEYIAPPAERAANHLRLQATNSVVAQEFRSGLWVKEDSSFINVREVLPDNRLSDIRIYQFDEEFNLEKITRAETGEFIAGNDWMMRNITETNISTNGVDLIHTDSRKWRTVLSPNILSVLLVAPEHMPAADLYAYIQHLSHNKQKTSRYEIALWNKLSYPFTAFSMMLLSLPFSQTQRRSTNVGLKLFIGIMLGLAFHFINSLFKHLGLLYDWPPLLSAIMITLVVLSLGAAMTWKQERR